MESKANSSSTFVPSLRSDKGPRTNDELHEIAANAFKIDTYYWLSLYAKMDFQDTRRLFNVLLNSAAKLHIRTQLVSASAEQIQEFLDLVCTPKDVPRLQALLPYELADEWPPSHVPRSSSAPRPKPKNAVTSFFKTELIALQKRMELKKLVVQNFAECGEERSDRREAEIEQERIRRRETKMVLERERMDMREAQEEARLSRLEAEKDQLDMRRMEAENQRMRLEVQQAEMRNHNAVMRSCEESIDAMNNLDCNYKVYKKTVWNH